jgi:hypothetical protein
MDVDILDQADNPRVSKPKFIKTIAYIKAYKKALKRRLGICGFHNYSAINRFRDAGTAEIFKELGCKRIYLTEAGGIFKFASFWTKKTKKGCTTNESCQLKATRFMFSLARKYTQIKRIYVYTWFGDVTPRFDAGLVAGGKPRKAYHEIKKRV